MPFPITISDANLWLAITSIILLVTVELLPPNHGNTGILIDRKKLRNIAIVTGIAFLITVTIGITTLANS